MLATGGCSPSFPCLLKPQSPQAVVRSTCSPDKWTSEPMQSQVQGSQHPTSPPQPTTSEALPAHHTSGTWSARPQQTQGCESLETKLQFTVPFCPDSAWPQRPAAASRSHHPVVAAVGTMKGSAKASALEPRTAFSLPLQLCCPLSHCCNLPRSLLRGKQCPG